MEHWAGYNRLGHRADAFAPVTVGNYPVAVAMSD
jgi:hypothetical protein